MTAPLRWGPLPADPRSGYYWWRLDSDSSPGIVQLWKWRDEFLVSSMGGEAPEPLDAELIEGGEWAGPLAEPPALVDDRTDAGRERPCPFCGSNEPKQLTDWWIEERGQCDYLRCLACDAEAPTETWAGVRTLAVEALEKVAALPSNDTEALAAHAITCATIAQNLLHPAQPTQEDIEWARAKTRRSAQKRK